MYVYPIYTIPEYLLLYAVRANYSYAYGFGCCCCSVLLGALLSLLLLKCSLAMSLACNRNISASTPSCSKLSLFREPWNALCSSRLSLRASDSSLVARSAHSNHQHASMSKLSVRKCVDVVITKVQNMSDFTYGIQVICGNAITSSVGSINRYIC
jgi:hypothetical protein